MTVNVDTCKNSPLNLPAIMKCRDDLNKIVVQVDAVAHSIGEPLDVLIPVMLQPYAKRLGVSLELVEQSLYALLGNKSDGYPRLQDCKNANWILAGNMVSLREGHPVSGFTKIYKPEWTPLAMVDGYEDIVSGGVKGSMYIMKSMAGYTTVQTFKKFIPSKSGGNMFVHLDMFGLPKFQYKFYDREERRPVIAPRIYVGMYTWALIEPGLPFGAAFERVECTPSFQGHNRKLFHDRFSECPASYPWECTECHIGYDTCRRGVHEETYERRTCVRCREVGNFKEGDGSSLCIDCRHRAYLRNKKEYVHRRSAHGPESEAKG